MLEPIKVAIAWLTAIDPAVPRALLVAAVLVTVLTIRKLFPRLWELFARVVPVPVIDPHPLLLVLSKAWQSLPALLIGAVLTSVTAGGDTKAAVKGAVAGALAALAHEVLKAVPWLPYEGSVGKRGLPPSATMALVFVLSLRAGLACSAFQHVDWPKVSWRMAATFPSST